MSLAELMLPKAACALPGKLREKAYAYLRVSHERSARKQLSPETQRREIEEYAARNNIDIVAWYTDLGKSAFKSESKRKDFQRLIKDAMQNPEISIVLVWKYDRFSRGLSAPVQQAQLLEHGVRLVSVTEGYLDPDSETGAIMSPMTWALSRSQSIRLRQVVTANMKVNCSQRDPETGWAYKNGGIPMWGYKVHRIVIGKDEKYMDVYRAIWLLDDTVVAGRPVYEWARTMLLEWRLKEGAGYRVIADRLTRVGIPTPKGRPGWSDSTIHSLLGKFDKLYQYAGYGFWNRRNWQSGYCRDRDKAEWILTPKAHPAIITEEQCDAIYAMTREATAEQRTARQRTAKQGSRWLLSGGVLACARCGSQLAGKKTDNDYYLCGSHIYRRGAGCGSSWYIRKDDIENLVFEKLLSQVKKGNVRKWVREVNESAESEWAEFQRTSRERVSRLAELEHRRANLIAVAEAGGDTQEIAARIREISDVIERLRAMKNAERPVPLTINAVQENLQKVCAALQSGDRDGQRAVVKNYIVQLVADPESQTITGTMIDPAYPTNSNGEPDCQNPSSPICRQLVGQGIAGETANHLENGPRYYAQSPILTCGEPSTQTQIPRSHVSCISSRLVLKMRSKQPPADQMYVSRNSSSHGLVIAWWSTKPLAKIALEPGLRCRPLCISLNLFTEFSGEVLGVEIADREH